VWGKDGLGPSDQFIGGVAGLGFPAPTAFAWAAALTEFVGALLLAAGLLTRPVALAVAFNMAVAAFGVHLHDPIVASGGGRSKEMALLYMAPAILFLLAGAGRYSLDALIARRSGGKSKPKPAVA
jgi:putative oxidoreductase